jgi:hypothetical protein
VSAVATKPHHRASPTSRDTCNCLRLLNQAATLLCCPNHVTHTHMPSYDHMTHTKNLLIHTHCHATYTQCHETHAALCPTCGVHAGIAVAELALMTTKSRTQLLQALTQHSTPLPKDMPPGLAPPPLTATVWAAAAWQEVCPAAGGACMAAGGTGRPGGRRGAATGDSLRTYQGLDLCLGDGTVHEGGVVCRERRMMERLHLVHCSPAGQSAGVMCCKGLLAGHALKTCKTRRPLPVFQLPFSE